MKRFVLTIISSCAMLLASAQEEIVLDSIQKKQLELDFRQLKTDKPFLMENPVPLERFNFMEQFNFCQPLLPDYNKVLNLAKYLNSSKITPETFSIQGYGILPFYPSGAIFNQAAYRLNDHLSIGGNSFGAQSIFDQPRLNSSIQDMSFRGASMFMQYKFSKNFKVETRVSITNRNSPLEP